MTIQSMDYVVSMDYTYDVYVFSSVALSLLFLGIVSVSYYRAMHFSAKRGIAIRYCPSVCPSECNVQVP